MEDNSLFHFFIILLCVAAAIFALAIGVTLWKQRKNKRLKSSRKDYFR